ncbi:MAG: DNA/RNA non-specific endonuclease [Pirellulaceae bacterium]|nr:DNA/RNA non-specific endonuclease [Pirellulaceae bacterium]
MSWQNLTFNGWLQVETEDFLWGWGASAQQRRRPVRVHGFIQPRSGSTARLRSGQTALALKGAGVNDGSVPNTEGGHVFGLDLGGVDTDANLVPMYGGVNRGAFREIERRLREFALFPGRGTCAAHIEIGYANAFAVGADPRVPEVFEVKCFEQVADLAAVTRTATAAWTELVANLEYPPARWDLSQFADVTRRATLLEIRQHVASNNWLIESLGDPFDDWGKASMGPNIYSNAAVTSAKYNRSMGRS